MIRSADRIDRIPRISKRTHVGRFRFAISALAAAVLLFIQAGEASAHCDTMDGPVVTDARKALEAEDVTPVLKWIPEADEPAITTAFEKTLTVRTIDARARELADGYFFETLVRLHRASEGEPYTGIQPAGTPVAPIIVASDRALANRSVSDLVGHLTEVMQIEIAHRFERAVSATETKDLSVAQGRDFVEAYVEYTHFIERLHHSLSTLAAHHDAD